MTSRIAARCDSPALLLGAAAEELLDLARELVGARDALIELFVDLIDDREHVGTLGESFLDLVAVRRGAHVERAEIELEPREIGKSRREAAHGGR